MKIALFVDFDNVYSGLRRISGEAAERFSRQPLRWLQWLTEAAEVDEFKGLPGDRRRILVRRCYLNPVVYQKYRRPFHEAGFEIVDCPPMTATGKTSTDIHLVLDTMDTLLDSNHFDEFIVLSADADFSPLLRRLRRHDRRTVVFAAGAMSESYKASADRVIDIQTFLRDALQLAPVEDDADVLEIDGIGTYDDLNDELRVRVAESVRRRVLEAKNPIQLPALAQVLQREFPSLHRGQWCGCGSFSSLMRQLEVPGVEFDFQATLAYDRERMDKKMSLPSAQQAPVATPDDPDPDLAQGRPSSEQLSSDELIAAAEAIVRRAVADSPAPVHFASIAQLLRTSYPQLSDGWAGAFTFARFLQRLRIEPLQSAVLEDGSTSVLYDSVRHDAPIGVVGDRFVAGMLRAAELPEIKGVDLIRILASARPHMGGVDPFEIAHVSREVSASLAGQGVFIGPRRVTSVLQALIFGGLDATRSYEETEDLRFAAMGVIISAWSRETQTVANDEARARLMSWLGPATEALAKS